MAHGNISSTGRISGGGGEGSNHYLIMIQFDPNQNGTYAMTCKFIYPTAINDMAGLLTQVVDGSRDVYGVTPSLMVDGFCYISGSDSYATTMYITYEDDNESQPGYLIRRYFVKCIEGNTLINKFIGQFVYEGLQLYTYYFVGANFTNIKI